MINNNCPMCGKKSSTWYSRIIVKISTKNRAPLIMECDYCLSRLEILRKDSVFHKPLKVVNISYIFIFFLFVAIFFGDMEIPQFYRIILFYMFVCLPIGSIIVSHLEVIFAPIQSYKEHL